MEYGSELYKWGVLWMNQVQLVPNVVGSDEFEGPAGATRSVVNAISLRLECGKVLFKAFLLPVVRQWYERKRDLELWLCRWTTLEVCWVLRRLIGCRMHETENYVV